MSYKTEKTTAGMDIVIDGFDKGIAPSPYLGIGDMRNIDPTTIPEEASVAMAPVAMITQGAITSVTFTVDPATDIFTYDGVVPLEVNTCITVVNSGGALPAGLAIDTAYYIKSTPSSTTFTVSSVSAGGALKNITDAGSGTNTFSTINMGTPAFIKQGGYENDPVGLQSNNLYFLLDSNGRCWLLNNSSFGSTNKWVYMHNLGSEALAGVSGTGNGLAVWKNWVFVFEISGIRIIPLIDAGQSTLAFLTTKGNWNGFQDAGNSINLGNLGKATVSHYAIGGQNGELYFCNGYSVGSVIEQPNETFAPNVGRNVSDGVTTNNSTTITSASMAFTTYDIGASITGTGIPTTAVILHVNSASSVEISVAATASGSSITFTIPTSYSYAGDALNIPTSDETICLELLGTNLLVGGIQNYIYVWDRIVRGGSGSYNSIIFLSEDYTSRMVTVNSTTYIFAGRRGRVYVTNGSNANLFYKIPDFLTGTVNPTFIWRDANFTRNMIFFSFSVRANGGSLAIMGGLWALEIDNKAGWLINKLSYNTYAGYASAITPNSGDTKSTTSLTGVFGDNQGYGLFIGWNDGTNGGIDRQDNNPYTGSQAYIDSDMIPVGTFLTKHNFQNVEFKLTTPLVTGESVALYYRENVTASFTLVPILEGGAVGDLSGFGNVNFENVQWIQVRAMLTSTISTTPSFCRLRELRIR